MNISTMILLPLASVSILLSTNAVPVIAADATVPAMSTTQSSNHTASARPLNVRFTPVPFRRTVGTPHPVMVASLSKEPAGSDREPGHEQNRYATVRPNGTFELIRNFVTKRVASYQANQKSDLLVPQPRDLEPSTDARSTVRQESIKLSAQPFSPAASIRNRKHIDSFTTMGIRTFH